MERRRRLLINMLHEYLRLGVLCNVVSLKSSTYDILDILIPIPQDTVS